MAKKVESKSFDDFEQILNDWDSLLKRKQSKKKSQTKMQLLMRDDLWIWIAIIVGAGWGLFSNVNWSRPISVVHSKPSAKTTLKLEDGQYAANFPFTNKSLNDIYKKMKSSQGYSVEEFVHDYGQPSEVESLMLAQESPSKHLTYETKKQPFNSLEARFSGKDDDWETLYSITYTGIEDPTVNQVTDSERTLTVDEVNNLKVGTSSGALGASYEEVVKAYGLPTSVSSSGYIDLVNEKEVRIASCTYYYEEGVVTLEFHKENWNSGTYYLAKKTKLTKKVN